jgi:hypothetical protein
LAIALHLVIVPALGWEVFSFQAVIPPHQNKKQRAAESLRADFT